jgi:hypothetical protein
MTRKEYLVKEQEILSKIPKEFHSYFSYAAWERGRAYGYEDVFIELSNMVDDDLVKAISDYRNNIQLMMIKLNC